MKHRILMLALLCAMVQGAWAQNGIYCTASDKNRVVCTDGTIYDNVAAATADGKTAAAKIIYIDESNKAGLALALRDEGQYTQADGITACNNKNTSMPVVGGTWKLASKSEWDKMISAAGSGEALFHEFSSVGGTDMFWYYWSSEMDESGVNGLIIQYYSGWSDFVSNAQTVPVRACLTFNLLTLYEIGSQSEWNEFCTAVNTGSTLYGNTFSDKYVKLTSDIIVSEMAGSSESDSFQGLFDGDGHTLTVSYNTEYAVTAPFRYVKNATIRNLKTTGTITTGGMSAAGIVGEVTGSLNLISCSSSVAISSRRGDIDAHGGLVACNRGNVTISGCVFDGSFAATVAHTNSYGTTFCGGIVGMCNDNTSATITNSLVAPSSVSEGMINKTFVGLYEVATVTIENCYFVATANLPTNQGTQVYYTAPANEISKSITISGTTVYSDACSVSGVEATYNLDSGLASVTPTLTDPSAATLTFGTDYTATMDGDAVQSLPVSISTAGNYTLVLTGAGSYTGTKTFNITATGDPVNSALIISSEAEWDTFAESVNNGTNYYSNQFVKLTADISVSTMVGTSEIPFSGTFLGNGHTITANITDTGNSGTALFRYINGTTIQDLTVAGTITGGLHAAAIVGIARGTGNSIRNCVATANVSGGTHIGGILGHATNSDIAISGCVFSGTMTGAYVKGAIVGWGDNGGTKSVTDCLYLMANGQNTYGLDLVRQNQGAVTVTNSYKTTSAGTYGTHCFSFTFPPAPLGNPRQDYGVLTAYEDAIFYDGTYYVAPATLSGSGTEKAPYLICNTLEWDSFVRYVNNGTTYSGQYVQLTDNISVSTMVGTSETNSFQGTFLGDGTHTLTFTKGTAESAFGEENCAPFRYVKNATIRDLKVTGDIYTSRKFAAGLVARNSGETNITNCQVGTVIHSSVSGDGTHGGIVAMPASNTTTSIAGCVYNGRLLTTSGTQYCGGFVGWHNGATISVSNSLYAPASSSIPTGWTAITSGTTFVRGGNPTITGCCYTETMGNAQGTQCFPAAVEPTALGELVKEYGVLKVYQNGIFYDGIYYMVPVSITLADNANNSTTIGDANGYMANVTLQSRTLYKDGAWNTLCLPFSMASFAGTPLEGATVKTLASTSFEDGTLTMNFTEDVSSIIAGKPYIVKWAEGAENIVNPVFDNVTISNVTANVSTVYVDFVGTYSPVSIYTDGKTNLYLSAGNKLYYPTDEDFTVNAFRGYFQLKRGLTAGSAGALARITTFNLNFGDDNSTGIITTNSTLSDHEWYTLDGRKLDGRPTVKGIYINNGRKVAIK